MKEKKPHKEKPPIGVAQHLWPYIGSIILIVLLTFIQTMLELQLPRLMAGIIDLGIAQKDITIVWETGLRMLLMTLGAIISAVIVSLFSSRTGAHFARDLRRTLFYKVEYFSLDEFDRFSTASLITRTTNDIDKVQMLVIMVLRMAVMAPIRGVGGILMAVRTEVSLTWIVAISLVLLIGLIILIANLVMPRYKKVQQLTDKLNLIIRENLSGIRVVRAFNSQQREEARLDGVNGELKENNLFTGRMMAFSWPLIILIMDITTLVIIRAALPLLGSAALPIGNLVAFIQYASMIFFSFLMISIMFIMIPRAVISGRRISEVLKYQDSKSSKSKSSETKDQKTDKIDNCRGEIEFSNVSYSYRNADTPALKGISFCAKPGETTAIIGSTGSGKTTLVNLLLRLYEVSTGLVKVDGVDIQKWDSDFFRRQIGYVSQKAILFNGSVKDNIAYGGSNSDESNLRQAAETAQALDFIESNKELFDYNIQRGGTNLSGGQRQRLAIARAIARNPKIYIFDDTFSALDYQTSSRVRKGLAKTTSDATVIIVAQRINMVSNADQILVLDEGEIVGVGKHSDLMESCSVYREIADSQLSDDDRQNERKHKGDNNG